MPGKVYYGFKKFLAVAGILAIMLGLVAFFAYIYIYPSVSPEVFTNPKRIVEAPERQRICEINDELINTYRYVGRKSQLMEVGSEEWVRSSLATLEADKTSFLRLDPMRTEGDVAKTYDNLVSADIQMLKRYVSLYEAEPESAAAHDVGIGEQRAEWDLLVKYYEAFKAADAEYLAKFDSA